MKFQWRIELPQLAILAAMILASAALWSLAPDQIPVHWNIEGEVDRYGGKAEGLLLAPAIGVGLYLLMFFLPRFDPGRANYPKFETAYNIIRYSLLIFLAVLHAAVLLFAFGYPLDIGLLVLLMMGSLFIVLGAVMRKIEPNWFVGVRTPWTLSSRASWTKTHRLAGWLFGLMGIVSILAGFVQQLWMFGLFFGVVILSLVWLFVYSYLVYRSDPHRVPPAGTASGE